MGGDDRPSDASTRSASIPSRPATATTSGSNTGTEREAAPLLRDRRSSAFRPGSASARSRKEQRRSTRSPRLDQRSQSRGGTDATSRKRHLRRPRDDAARQAS